MSCLPPAYVDSANPRFIEIAFLSGPAIEFFAQEQLVALQDWYAAIGQSLDPIDATLQGQEDPGPRDFLPPHNVDVRMYQTHQRGYCCCTNFPVQVPPGTRHVQCPNSS